MFQWNPENVKELKTLVARQFSTAKIAQIIGAPSRNAVLGKIHRMQLREGFKWSDETEQKLRELWEAGVNYGKIAKKLGAPSGSAVYGKGLRMGLKPRATKSVDVLPPGTPGKRAVPVTLAGAIVVRPDAMAWPAEASAIVRKRRPDEGVPYFETGPGMCRFPLWPDNVRMPLHEKMFCGDPAELGKAYCAACRFIMTDRITLAEWRRRNRGT